MIRVVLDTNIIVSAYVIQNRPPFRVFKLALASLVRLCVSEPILAEYQELRQRKRLPMDARRAALFLKAIRDASLLVKQVTGLAINLPDPDDKIFLECAEVAKAGYLVTGNAKHFPKQSKYTQRIMSTAFLAACYADHSAGSVPLSRFPGPVFDETVAG